MKPSPKLTLILSFVLLALHTGCVFLPADPVENGVVAQIPNPIRITISDHDLAWNTIVDTVDDYFDIVEENRVKAIGGVLTDGHIVTKAKLGSGVQEFWQKDSTPGYERWHSTFQTTRRRANLRIVPVAGAYDVQVVVEKELEDLDRPEQAAIGRNLSRHDGTIVRQSPRPEAGPIPLGWIPLGRDTSLEQTMLADIQARFVNVSMPNDIQLLPPLHPPVDLRH